ncbi:YggS family pyridoxal phosphate enzyme, partial [Mannheimia haemolytica]
HQRDDVRLLAVSKTKPVEAIQEAIEGGQRAFGENYVQEAIEKIECFANRSDLEWHFIGPLPSNKTKLVAAHSDSIQTVD